MNRIWLAFLLMAVPGAADDFETPVVGPSEIFAPSLRPVKSFEAAKAIGYLIETSGSPQPRLVQVFFDAAVDVSRLGLNITNLRCLSPTGSQVPLNLATGAPACGVRPLVAGKSRDLTFEIRGILFANATKPVDAIFSASYVDPRFAALEPPVTAGEREVYLGVEMVVKDVLLRDLQAHQKDLKVTLKFDPKDSVPDYDLAVTGVRLSGSGEPLAGNGAGSYIKISLSGLLPSRPLAYKVVLSLNKSLLSPELQQRVDPDEMEVSFVAAMGASSTPARDKADFFLDTTFTSYVNQFDASKAESPSNNGKRRNVGLFALSYTPVGKQWSGGLSGEAGTRWFAARPYVNADVSTLALKEAETPTQIADGLDLVYGFNSSKPLAGLRGFVATAGGRHESDRDFKFQIVTGRFTLAPVIRGLAQSRAYRDQLAAKSKKSFRVTSYSFRPKVGYEIGDVVRDRPERLLDNISFQDRISRFLINFDMAVEFKRLVTISASDVYYYHWQVDRRPQRNYLEAKLDLNAGYLFRRFGSRELSYGITGKFQRGEQSPTFKVVNVFSLGLTFVR